MIMRPLLAVVALCLSLTAAISAPLSDPREEMRAQALFRELRCLVCQNQSIVDSNAPLAEDLRGLVRERIDAKDSNAQIKEFLVARYGEFILLRPRLTLETALLWGAPVLALLLGLILSFRVMSRRRTGPASLQLDSREEERLQALMEQGDDRPAA
jgi:cytochrome c-type biogenesis protein CcmH